MVLPVMVGVGTEHRLEPRPAPIAELPAGPIFSLG